MRIQVRGFPRLRGMQAAGPRPLGKNQAAFVLGFRAHVDAHRLQGVVRSFQQRQCYACSDGHDEADTSCAVLVMLLLFPVAAAAPRPTTTTTATTSISTTLPGLTATSATTTAMTTTSRTRRSLQALEFHLPSPGTSDRTSCNLLDPA